MKHKTILKVKKHKLYHLFGFFLFFYSFIFFFFCLWWFTWLLWALRKLRVDLCNVDRMYFLIEWCGLSRRWFCLVSVCGRDGRCMWRRSTVAKIGGDWLRISRRRAVRILNFGYLSRKPPFRFSIICMGTFHWRALAWSHYCARLLAGGFSGSLTLPRTRFHRLWVCLVAPHIRHCRRHSGSRAVGQARQELHYGKWFVRGRADDCLITRNDK